MPKSANLEDFKVPKKAAVAAPTAPRQQVDDQLKIKGFRMTPEAIRQFEILRAELGVKQKDLIAEAMNLLFQKYKKPTIA